MRYLLIIIVLLAVVLAIALHGHINRQECCLRRNTFWVDTHHVTAVDYVVDL